MAFQKVTREQGRHGARMQRFLETNVHPNGGHLGFGLRYVYPLPTEKPFVDLKTFKPTAIAVAPDGTIFLADGYASNRVFKFDAAGKYLAHFGTKGNGPDQFNTCHGMNVDARDGKPRLLICDRGHEPKGRLVHYDFDGKYLGDVVTGLGKPCSLAIQGEFVSIPDLQGRLTIINGANTVANH